MALLFHFYNSIHHLLFQMINLLASPLAFGHSSFGSIVLTIIGLLILWVIVSIPVYIAAKLVVGNKASFGRAMLATLVGPIIFIIVLALGSLVSSNILGGSLEIIAIILAFLAWIWVFKAVFNTGWLHALGIAILSVIVTIVIVFVLSLIGIAL